MPLSTTARSCVKTEAALDSSGGSSRTSRPKLRTAVTRAACCRWASVISIICAFLVGCWKNVNIIVLVRSKKFINILSKGLLSLKLTKYVELLPRICSTKFEISQAYLHIYYQNSYIMHREGVSKLNVYLASSLKKIALPKNLWRRAREPWTPLHVWTWCWPFWGCCYFGGHITSWRSSSSPFKKMTINYQIFKIERPQMLVVHLSSLVSGHCLSLHMKNLFNFWAQK